ncbi:hypothetical protein GGI16_008902, partial [Coemansia sp. S142-1]
MTTQAEPEPATGREGRRGFARTLSYWTLGTGSLSMMLYYMGKDEIEAFDTESPLELTLVPDTLYKGHPVVQTPHTAGRERLVVLGSGWGAVSTLKALECGAYDVTVISPDNYFIFTPLLPSVTVGTVEFRSVLEAIRRIIKRTRGSYIEAAAVDIDLERKMVLVKQAGEEMAWVPYDRLVV